MVTALAVLALVFAALSIALQAFCARYPTPADAREAWRRLRRRK